MKHLQRGSPCATGSTGESVCGCRLAWQGRGENVVRKAPDDTRQDRTGFTLIELLTAIAIITILAGMLLPVFSRAREKARQVSCIANQKQLAVATELYCADNDGFYPAVYNNGVGAAVHGGRVIWADVIASYCKNRALFACSSGNPEVVDVGKTGDLASTRYCMNIIHGHAWPEGVMTHGRYGYPIRNSYLQYSSEAVLFLESGNSWCTHWNPYVAGQHQIQKIDGNPVLVDSLGCTIYPRHNGGLTVSFCDGHVKWYRPTMVADHARFFSFW